MFRLKNSLISQASSGCFTKKFRSNACRLTAINFNETEEISDSKYVCFEDMIYQRKKEAEKSLIIQVSSEKSYTELFSHCSQFGSIKSAFHYKVTEDQNHFVLLEYEDDLGVREAFENSRFNDGNSGVPVHSPFLWFRMASGKPSKIKQNYSAIPLIADQETRQMSEVCLNEKLSKSQSIDEQMKILYKKTSLNDLNIRLRFLLARQIETAVKGMFSSVQAFPFGSSVNGFGKIGCDLDLILRLSPDKQKSPDLRLIFHTKSGISNERSQTQRQMETIGDILHLFLPGINNVRRILQARVPILKFNHECLDLEVDLSMSNLTGVYMSELLYMFGEADSRVRPLTFCIRKWANATGLTNPSPGRWISNFSLTCLVIFFLQRLEKPILPTVDFLMKSARSEDIRETEDNINCTFLRDLSKLNFPRTNKDSLEHLLVQFFEFYSLFDFSQAISLNAGRAVTKPDHSALFILNPFEQLLNVSKNVSLEEVERFKFAVKNAAWMLESKNENSDDSSVGLLNLFKSTKQTQVRPQMFYKSRLVEVLDLFGNNDEPVEFKSESMKNQVQAIRKTTKQQIKKMELAATKNKTNHKES